MQRDWDLVRQILLKLAEREEFSNEALVHVARGRVDRAGGTKLNVGDTASALNPEDVPPYDADNVAYHMKILGQAGLIEAECSESTAGTHCFAFALTWAGQEFLDNALRDQKRWSRVKALAREKGTALSFEVIKAAASAIIGGLFK